MTGTRSAPALDFRLRYRRLDGRHGVHRHQQRVAVGRARAIAPAPMVPPATGRFSITSGSLNAAWNGPSTPWSTTSTWSGVKAVGLQTRADAPLTRPRAVKDRLRARGHRGRQPIFTAVPLTATSIMPLVSPSTA